MTKHGGCISNNAKVLCSIPSLTIIHWY